MRNRRTIRKYRKSISGGPQLFAELLEPRIVLHGDTASLPSPFVGDAGDRQYISTLSHEHETAALPYLQPQYRISPAGSLLSGPTEGEPLEMATHFLRNHATELGLDPDDFSSFAVTSQYSDVLNGATHIYLRQMVDGLEVMNADVSISLTADGEVIHAASSFISDPRVIAGTSSQYIISASQALMGLSDELGLDIPVTPQVIQTDSGSPDRATRLTAEGGGLKNVSAMLVYVPTAAGLELAWRLDVQTTDNDHWYDAVVGATTGESMYTDDRIDHAAYHVFPQPVESPNDGGRSIVIDPHDNTASPFGWHDTNGVAGGEFTDTRGNNASAQEDANHDDAGGFRPSGGASLNFDFPLNTSENSANYQSAAITNAFYWVNLLHDIHYQYGFTEAAGNFQTNNYGRGGTGNDPVLVDIQDGDGGTDSFVALPDGQSPRMTLYRRDNPFRDRAFDSDILVHEYGHGISERLTGGPGNTAALNAKQSKGMGEGWGDWWALMLMQVPADAKPDAFPIGNYAAGFPNDGPGIRRYPYSFDMSINPLTYNSFNGGAANNEQHKAGEIWCSALWDLNWLLIDKHGFSSDLYHGNGGNNLALQLVMDGLKLQGTNPSFLAGRDAILAADVALTGGQNQSEIWTAFARRGMGFSASDGGGAGATTVAEAFDVPASISGTVYRDDDASGTQNGAEPGLTGWSVYLDQNNNGVADQATTTVYNSTDTPKAITDHGITYSNKVVSGLSGTIVDINVTVNLTHPFDGELYLTLISPTNTPVILANYLGGGGDNYTNTVFDDEASSYISSASAPFTGSFRPYFDLAQLDGRDPNGTWKLRMDDAVSGNAGQLLSWSMQITSGDPDPVVMTDADGDYSFHGLGIGVHHIRSVVPPGFTQTAPVSGVHDVTISEGQPINGRGFGNRAAATVASAGTLEDTLSNNIVITPPTSLGVSHFRMSGISGGTLFKSDGTTFINNGDFITVAEGQSGVRFLPSINSTATGYFDVELSPDGVTVPADTSRVTGVISVTTVNDGPAGLSFINPVTTLPDSTITSAAVVLADISIEDDELGNNQLTLSGDDSGFFEIIESQLRLKSGVTLNPEVKFQYAVMVNVDDSSVGATPDASAEFQFVVTRLIPLIVTPGAATVELRPLLSWSKSFDADGAAVGYDIWISNQSTNVAEFHRRTVSGNFYTPDVDLGIGRFGLWVRSVFASGNKSAWTPRRDFQVYAKVSTLPMAAQQANAKPTLQWYPLTGAVRYDVWISNLTTGQSQFVRNQNIPDTSWTAETDMPLGKYRAWVRGIDAAGIPAQWSTAVDFTVMPAPSLTGPLQSTFNRRPAFSWIAVAGAVSYEVYLRNQNTGATVYRQKNIMAVSWTPPVNLADGSCRWWVQATGAGGVLSFWSPPVDFYIGGRTDLLSPTGIISQSSLTFTWRPVDGAVRYDLWVDQIGGQSQIIRQTSLTGAQYTPTQALAPGYYRAWIRAVSIGSEVGVWSTAIQFKVVAVNSPEAIPTEPLAELLASWPLELFERPRASVASGSSDRRMPWIPELLADSAQAVRPRLAQHESTTNASARREFVLEPNSHAGSDVDVSLCDLVMIAISNSGFNPDVSAEEGQCI